MTRACTHWIPTTFLAALLLAGCAGPSATIHPYHVVTNDCNCEEYRTRDSSANVYYLFRARYAMTSGITTTIDIVVTNRTRDTVFFSPGAVRISSTNIQYNYNDRFLPLPDTRIGPGAVDSLTLKGKDPDDQDDWHKVAGELLVVTLKGMRLGDRELHPQEVAFVPVNPKMERQK
jgi:hypothetical protein